MSQDLSNLSAGMVFRGRQTVTELAGRTMRSLLPAEVAGNVLPFEGAARTLDGLLETAKRLDPAGHAPDHIARMVIGADRTPDTATLYRIFEHFSNALAIIEARLDDGAKAPTTAAAIEHKRK